MWLTLLIVFPFFGWLLWETDFLTIRLESTEYQRAHLAKTDTKLLTAGKPVLMLNAGNPDKYPMTLKTTTKELKVLLDQLAKTDLTLTEEVWGYDYSDQT